MIPHTRGTMAAAACLVVALACFGSACGTQAPVTSTSTDAVSTTGTAPGTPTSTAPSVTSSPGLALSDVRNAEITLLFAGDMVTFTFKDGVASSGQTSSGSGGQGEVAAAMSGLSSFGDLDGDGVGDAVVALGVGKGSIDANAVLEGSPGITQYVVALLSEGGRPVQGGYHLLGAGASTGDLSISGGEITVAAFVPASEEPAGPPAVLVTAGLRLPFDRDTTRELLHVGQSTETPAGQIREIVIGSPARGATVAMPCTIKGSITISPFENNLVLRAYTPDMIERVVDPVTVTAPDLGAPGTFEVQLTLTGVTGPVFVIIADVSAADGSILALASVELVVK